MSLHEIAVLFRFVQGIMFSVGGLTWMLITMWRGDPLQIAISSMMNALGNLMLHVEP